MRDRHTGSKVGPYVLEAKLGQGGMGMVYRARHVDGSAAALKVIARATSSSAHRFEREAQALRALNHPHVVRYVGAGGGPPPWLAMELIDGDDLDARLKIGPLGFAEAARLVGEIASGVAHAHEHGIVHRDLKPPNILVRADQRAVVTDFGLAKDLDGSRFTQTGTMLGTIAYMSPEQLSGKRETGRPTDVWSLGGILYRCVCDREPFLSTSNIAVVSEITEGSYPRPSSLVPQIPAALEAVIRDCLQVQPENRPTAAEVSRRLLSWDPSSGGRRSKVPAVSLAIAAVVLAGVVGLAVAYRSGPAPAPAPPAPPAPPVPGPTVHQELPWGPASEPWSRAWTLSQGAPPQIDVPVLWTEPGRVAQPLSALGSDAGLRAAFLGDAERLEGGRVRVRYTDLGRSLERHIVHPVGFFTAGDGAGSVTPVANGVEVFAKNDSTVVSLNLGSARWREPRLRASVRRIAREDAEGLTLMLGTKPDLASLALTNRSGTLKTRQASAHFQLAEAWEAFEFAPGLEAPRVRAGSADVSTLDRAADAIPSPGPVQFLFAELHAGLDGVSIEGQPLRTDVPALAIAPAPLTSSVRVAAQFDQGAVGMGGPFVALVGPKGPALTLEVDGSRLVLKRGARILLNRDLHERPVAGWLLLERGPDSVRCVVVGTGRLDLRVEHPLPLAAPLRAAYGSTAPDVRFAEVEVQVGPEDEERALIDRACAAGKPRAGLGALERSTSALSEWRRGAWVLAQVSDPDYADLQLTGGPQRSQRRRNAGEALRLLRSAAGSLDGDARADALARALFAALLSVNPEAGAEVARELVAHSGREAAVERLDRFERQGGEPVFAKRFSQGYGGVYNPAMRETGLALSISLFPDREAEVLLELGDCVRHRRPPVDPRTSEGRAALEWALTLYARARELGAPELRANSVESETLIVLGRFREALVLLERNIALDESGWWGWLRSSQCHENLGEPAQWVESALGSLARAPQRQLVWAQLQAGLQALAKAGGNPGLEAAGMLALGWVSGRDDVVAHAAKLAQGQRATSARGLHLQAYVLVASGSDVPMPPADDVPAGLLVRARLGDSEALAALRVASVQDPLVRSLALLDKSLVKHLR